MFDDDYDYTFSVTLVGDSGVGKTCLMKQFVNGEFDSEESYTFGIEGDSKIVGVLGKRIKLSIWDPTGQENFKPWVQRYCSGSGIILLCCDLRNRKSFENLESHLRDVREHLAEGTVIGVVGTKVDDTEVDFTLKRSSYGREVTDQDLITFTKQNGLDFYSTCSAKNDINLERAFRTAAEKRLKRHEKAWTEILTKFREKNIDLESLRKIYKDQDGGFIATRRVFGFFQAKPRDKVVAALVERSKKCQFGASAKTLQAAANGSAEAVTTKAQLGQSSSSSNAASAEKRINAATSSNSTVIAETSDSNRQDQFTLEL